MARKMSEDFIGICQWCFGEYKVNARREMVLHGYQRPGIGYTLGNCRGVGHAPFEDAHDLTDIRIKELHEGIAKNNRAIANIDAGKIEKLRNPSYLAPDSPKRRNSLFRTTSDNDTEFLFPGDRLFAYYLKAMRAELESEIRFDEGVIAFLDNAVKNWKKLPIVGLDSPATGRERYVRDAYDPIKAKEAEAFAQRKAERDAKPGKITINFYRPIPFPKHTGEWTDETFQAAMKASYDAEKAFRDEVKAWAKSRFPGKIWVGDGDNQPLRHIFGHDAWSHPDGRVEVVAIKPEWQYLDEVLAMFPTAFRYDKDTIRRDPVTKQGIGKGKDIRIWVDGAKLP